MEAKRILWVDDDADLLMGLIRPLEKDGHEIVVVKDEKEALEKVKESESDFDLMLFDIIIPTGVKGAHGDVPFVGMRLLRELLIKMKIETPVIVLSVVRDPKLINEMYKMGVKKVLPKGACLPSELKETVYAALDVL
jgi:CheY-like chemotaxis protein